MSKIDRCSRDYKAPPPTNIQKYKSECGQNDRPGKHWHYVDNENDADGTDEKTGRHYKWSGPRREFRKTSLPKGSLGLYKNNLGCRRYNAKKEACGPLHPKDEEGNDRLVEKDTIDRNNTRALGQLMEKYNSCIDSIDLMNACVQSGVDHESDFGHQEEKRFRQEDLKQIT